MIAVFHNYEAWKDAASLKGYAIRLTPMHEYPHENDPHEPVVAFYIGLDHAPLPSEILRYRWTSADTPLREIGFWDQDERTGFLADNLDEWVMFENTGEGAPEDDADLPTTVNDQSDSDYRNYDVDAASDWARDEEALN